MPPKILLIRGMRRLASGGRRRCLFLRRPPLLTLHHPHQFPLIPIATTPLPPHSRRLHNLPIPIIHYRREELPGGFHLHPATVLLELTQAVFFSGEGVPEDQRFEVLLEG